MDSIVTEMQHQQRPVLRSNPVRQQSLQDPDEVSNHPVDIEERIMMARRASEPPDARKAVMGEFAS